MSRQSPVLSPRNGSVSLKRIRGNTLVGIFIGLLLGLALAAAVAYFITKSPSPFQSPVASSKADIAKSEIGGKSLPVAGEKPRFDFYKILPGTEEARPAAAVEIKAQPNTTVSMSDPQPKAAETKAGDRYFLQAGAFQTEADAENQKARLALLGLEASIQSVALADKGTLYRVRLGPYDNTEELNRSKSELARRGVDAAVIKNP